MGMSFSGFFKKNSAIEVDFSQLEDELSDIIDLDLKGPPLDVQKPAPLGSGDSAEDEPPASSEAQPADGPVGRALTAHAQSRLSALSTVEELQRGAGEDLQLLGTTVAKISAAHHSTQQFLNAMHASIHRASELEIANAELVAENRKLLRQTERVKKLRSQQESLAEAYRRREVKLQREVETLRDAHGAARLEATEARNSVYALENERTDMANELAGKSSVAERLARENEVLREKKANLMLDLENLQTRHTETERKLNEISAIHTAETGQLAELRSELAGSEKEAHRLRKQYDTAQSRLAETQETLSAAETEMGEAAKRHASEIQALKSEIDSLKTRLDVAAKAQQEAAHEMGALKQQLCDEAEGKKAAEQRLAALKQEHEAERRAHSASATDATQLKLQQESNAMLLDVHKQEVDDLHKEVNMLRTTVRRLSRFESMYLALKKRGASKAFNGAASASGSDNETAGKASSTSARKKPKAKPRARSKQSALTHAAA